MKVHLPRFIRHDALRKVVALFFAILIWWAVNSELSETLQVRNVPVTIRHDAVTLVREDVTPTVDVVVRGSRKRLENVTSNDIEIVAPIPSDIPEGVYFYGVAMSPEKNVLKTPVGIRVTHILPNRLEVQIDRIVTKADVPVKVQFDGELKEGYRVVRAQAVPSTVSLNGAHRKLLDINEVQTEPVLLDDTVVQDFSVTVHLVPIPGVKMIDSVRVDVIVSRHSTPKVLHGLHISLLQAPTAHLRLKKPLPPVTVTVRGPKTALNQLTELSVIPFIELSSIATPGRYRRQVEVWLDAPDEVVADAPNPGWVEVELEALPEVLDNEAPERETKAPEKKTP